MNFSILQEGLLRHKTATRLLAPTNRRTQYAAASNGAKDAQAEETAPLGLCRCFGWSLGRGLGGRLCGRLGGTPCGRPGGTPSGSFGGCQSGDRLERIKLSFEKR
jgi:hypothetical protein